MASFSTNHRIRVLSLLGDLMDAHLLTEQEVGSLMEVLFRGDREVLQISDVIDSRPSSNGKAQFLKIFLSISVIGQCGGGGVGYTTPGPCFFPHATPFVEFPSPILRSASPATLRFPTAIRQHVGGEQLVRIESDEVDPKMSPSTNVGSSMDTSVISPPVKEGNNCTVCSS